MKQRFRWKWSQQMTTGSLPRVFPRVCAAAWGRSARGNTVEKMKTIDSTTSESNFISTVDPLTTTIHYNPINHTLKGRLSSGMASKYLRGQKLQQSTMAKQGLLSYGYIFYDVKNW